jgi:thiamine-phosphate pyrophosphorylase
MPLPDSRVQPLYPILDADSAAARGHDLAACARGFAALGLARQQLRAKTLGGREFLALADRLRPVVPELIVNDRLDVALMAGAAGVHLGQDDVPLEAARLLAPQGFLVGLSTHHFDQVDAALAAQPDYLAYGPVFTTTTKLKPDPVVGVQALATVKPRWAGPLVAIGGISINNCGEVWRAGADAVAVISALWAAASPVEAAHQFLLAFERQKLR